MIGNLLVIANTVLFGFYITYSEWLCSKYPTQQVSAWAFFFGTVCVVSTSFVIDARGWLDLNHLSISAWGSIIYAALIATAWAYGYATVLGSTQSMHA
jgi:drug/metabolite transporter (DMT)-like permease